MKQWQAHIWMSVALAAASILLAAQASAHHVLGRPAYALNEDSNTPPAMQVETWVGDYEFNYMVFPAFPKPEQPGRVNLYVTHIDSGEPFAGRVTFVVKDNSWRTWLGLGAAPETIGVQSPDDLVFRQGFIFRQAGDYLITAQFEASGEPYIIDFPLRVGAPSPWGPLGITVAVLLFALVGVSLLQRRRAMTGKIRGSHERAD